MIRETSPAGRLRIKKCLLTRRAVKGGWGANGVLIHFFRNSVFWATRVVQTERHHTVGDIVVMVIEKYGMAWASFYSKAFVPCPSLKCLLSFRILIEKCMKALFNKEAFEIHRVIMRFLGILIILCPLILCFMWRDSDLLY